VRYYSDPTFTKRLLPAPDQSAFLNVPTKPKIDWLHERPKGTQLTLPGTGNNAVVSDGRSSAVPDDEVDREVPDERPHSGGEYA